MKRIIAIILACFTAFSLFSCKKEHKHANNDSDMFCDGCGEIFAVVENEKMSLNVEGADANALSAYVSDALTKGAKGITLGGVLTGAQLSALSSALSTVTEKGSISLFLPDMESLGTELNNLSALRGYVMIKDGTYAVYNEEGLLTWLYSDKSNFIRSSLILLADITLTAPDDENKSNWRPPHFAGEINGNGHTVTGLRLRDDCGSQFAGFIGRLSEGSVKNLVLADVDFDYTPALNMGGIVGVADRGTKIIGCVVESGTIVGSTNVGGIAGICIETEITNCHNFASITTDGSATGGIAGQVTDLTVITACTNAGSISGGKEEMYGAMVGGICGTAPSVRIVACFNSGSVSAKGTYPIAGGIVGNTRYDLEGNYWFDPSGSAQYGIASSKSNEGAKKLDADITPEMACEEMNAILEAKGIEVRYTVTGDADRPVAVQIAIEGLN